jgi:hypothetical protein
VESQCHVASLDSASSLDVCLTLQRIALSHALCVRDSFLCVARAERAHGSGVLIDAANKQVSASLSRGLLYEPAFESYLFRDGASSLAIELAKPRCQ